MWCVAEAICVFFSDPIAIAKLSINGNLEYVYYNGAYREYFCVKNSIEPDIKPDSILSNIDSNLNRYDYIYVDENLKIKIKVVTDKMGGPDYVILLGVKNSTETQECSACQNMEVSKALLDISQGLIESVEQIRAAAAQASMLSDIVG